MWWLFLHRRLRPGNEAQLSSSYLAPFGGSSSEESHSFLSEWFRKASQPSLAQPFGFDSRRLRFSSRLPPLSPSASPHRSPIPAPVSKAVTSVTFALYAYTFFSSTFVVFYFSGKFERHSKLQLEPFSLRHLSGQEGDPVPALLVTTTLFWRQRGSAQNMRWVRDAD